MQREHEGNDCAKCQSNQHIGEIKEANEILKSEKESYNIWIYGYTKLRILKRKQKNG